MHVDVHWKCTSRTVFHLPDGRRLDSCPQNEPRHRQQSPKLRPRAPLSHWWIVINLAYTSAHKLRIINYSIKQLHEHSSFCLLPVEESTTSCSDEPVAIGETPEEDSTLFVVPYEEVKFNIKYMSQLERFVTSFECLHFKCEAPCSAPINSHSSVEKGPPKRWQLLLCDPSPVSHDAKWLCF